MAEKPEAVEEVFTVNGVLRPRIEIAPKERQFWRIVNASPDRYLDRSWMDRLEIVALDGMPLAYHDPKVPTRTTDDLRWRRPDGSKRSSPDHRLDHIVLCARFVWMPVRTEIPIRRWCWQIWCSLVPDWVQLKCTTEANAPYRRSSAPLQAARRSAIEEDRTDFTVTFTEDKNGFYINGRKFAPDASSITSARVGTYQHWRIVNETAELHPSTSTRSTSLPTPKTVFALPSCLKPIP
jgi:hypothetical protein